MIYIVFIKVEVDEFNFFVNGILFFILIYKLGKLILYLVVICCVIW